MTNPKKSLEQRKKEAYALREKHLKEREQRAINRKKVENDLLNQNLQAEKESQLAYEQSKKQAASDYVRDNMKEVVDHPLWNLPGNIYASIPSTAINLAKGFRKNYLDGKRILMTQADNVIQEGINSTTNGEYALGGNIQQPPKKEKKPIVVSDENDPRYKAYQDSLELHKTSLKNMWAEKNISKSKVTKKGFIPFNEFDTFIPGSNLEINDKNYYPGNAKIVNGKIEKINGNKVSTTKKQNLIKNNIEPIGFDVNEWTSKGSNKSTMNYSTIYKKPQEEVIVRKTPLVNPIKLEDEQYTPINSTREVKPVVRSPKKYKVETSGGGKFGGWTRTEEVTDPNNISLDKGNKRVITPMYALGGEISTDPKNKRLNYENELMSRVITERNKNLNFVQRGLNSNEYPKIVNNDNTVSTHELGYVTDDNGNAYVRPNIVQNKLGLLERLNNSEATKHSFNTGETIKIPDVELADYYSKNGLIKHALGGNIQQTNNMNNITTYNEGGLHETNPNGGIPMGQSPEGQMNTVEQGEARMGDMIYSNRIPLSQEAVEAVGLPRKFIGKTPGDI